MKDLVVKGENAGKNRDVQRDEEYNKRLHKGKIRVAKAKKKLACDKL